MSRCAVRTELNEAWARALDEFSELMNLQTGERLMRMSREERSALRKRIVKAWIAHEKAHAALERHTREHGCLAVRPDLRR